MHLVSDYKIANSDPTMFDNCFGMTRLLSPADLLVRYTGQMRAYQSAMSQVFGVDSSMVECRIVSTSLGEVIEENVEENQRELDLI